MVCCGPPLEAGDWLQLTVISTRALIGLSPVVSSYDLVACSSISGCSGQDLLCSCSCTAAKARDPVYSSMRSEISEQSHRAVCTTTAPHVEESLVTEESPRHAMRHLLFPVQIGHNWVRCNTTIIATCRFEIKTADCTFQRGILSERRITNKLPARKLSKHLLCLIALEWKSQRDAGGRGASQRILKGKNRTVPGVAGSLQAFLARLACGNFLDRYCAAWQCNLQPSITYVVPIRPQVRTAVLKSIPQYSTVRAQTPMWTIHSLI